MFYFTGVMLTKYDSNPYHPMIALHNKGNRNKCLIFLLSKAKMDADFVLIFSPVRWF